MFSQSFQINCWAVVVCIVLSVAGEQSIVQNSLAGEPNASFESLVVNGKNAGPYQFPWLATVFVQREQEQVLFVSGTLISRQAVLTHADQLSDGDDSKAFIYVRLGSNKFDAGARIAVTSVFFHPQYNTPQDRNQIHSLAILRLNRTVTIGRNIAPILLPPHRFEHFAFENEKILFAGYGSNVPSAGARLKYAQFRIETIENCSHTFPLPSNSNHMILCAKHETNARVHPGYGDVGSPMAWRHDNHNYVVGIFDRFIDVKNLLKAPYGFINIAAHTRWVAEIIHKIDHTPTPKPRS